MDTRRFAYVQEGEVVSYPVTFRDIQRAHPNVSFPANVSEDGLLPYGYVVVYAAPKPRPTVDVTPVEGVPELISGIWRQRWVLQATTQEGQTHFTARIEADVREKRNRLLGETDYMALSDNTLTPEWAAYRQALRDITGQSGFPFDVTWPTKP